MHAPLQPVKVDPRRSRRQRHVRRWRPLVAAHVAPQLMPAGLLVTVPLPVPALATVSVHCIEREARRDGLRGVHRDRAAGRCRVHAPLQPVKVDPRRGGRRQRDDRAVGEVAAQVAPQLMPAGLR